MIAASSSYINIVLLTEAVDVHAALLKLHCWMLLNQIAFKSNSENFGYAMVFGGTIITTELVQTI